MKMIDLKCAQCGKSIKVEENRRFCFCTYCGSKIDIPNEVESVLRSSSDQADEIRLKELEIEKEKQSLRGTLIKVWVFAVVVLAVVAIEILMKDRDNPNSLGYLLLLVDFNMALWPVLFIKKGSRK